MGKLRFSDIVMSFFVIISFMAMAPRIYSIVDMVQGEVSGFSAVILGIFPAMLILALVLSTGLLGVND